METPMTKARLLELMDDGRARWTALLAEVGAARMTTPGVDGAWTVKDTIAHCTTWATWIVRRLEEIARNEPYVRDEVEQLEIDARNARYFAQNRDLALAQVLADDPRVADQLRALVAATPDADLLEVGHIPWLGESPLWQVVAANAYEHYDEHISLIRAWMARPPA